MTTLATPLYNVHVKNQERIPTPRDLKTRLPLSALGTATVSQGRSALADVLDRKIRKLVVVVGPCSIHDPKAARDYGLRLKALAAEVSDVLLIVMRVYFEKPRTTTGWKGLINDPRLDDSFHIEEGLGLAREVLIELNEMGLPCATEALDPIVPQYISDLIAWSAIGARTSESQTHREMASGLSMPVGIKNGTDGSLVSAVNALHAVRNPHSFLGIDEEGVVAVTHTTGNGYAHVVLRGGTSPNYDSVSVKLTEEALAKAGLPLNIMVDCSHGNSSKRPELQPLVFADCVNQIAEGNQSIIGLMLESHLHRGNQALGVDPSQLKYGVSITDGCIDWNTTEQTLLGAAAKLRLAWAS